MLSFAAFILMLTAFRFRYAIFHAAVSLLIVAAAPRYAIDTPCFSDAAHYALTPPPCFFIAFDAADKRLLRFQRFDMLSRHGLPPFAGCLYMPLRHTLRYMLPRRHAAKRAMPLRHCCHAMRRCSGAACAARRLYDATVTFTIYAAVAE